MKCIFKILFVFFLITGLSFKTWTISYKLPDEGYFEDIAVDEKFIYLINQPLSYLYIIDRFSKKHYKIKQFPLHKSISYLTAIDLSPEPGLIIAESINNNLYSFKTRFTQHKVSRYFKHISDVSVFKNKLYVLDSRQRKIVIFKIKHNILLGPLKRIKLSTLTEPTSLCVISENKIIVGEFKTGIIALFNQYGVEKKRLRLKGRISDICRDFKGKIYLTDYTMNIVRIFSSNLKLLNVLGLKKDFKLLRPTASYAWGGILFTISAGKNKIITYELLPESSLYRKKMKFLSLLSYFTSKKHPAMLPEIQASYLIKPSSKVNKTNIKTTKPHFKPVSKFQKKDFKKTQTFTLPYKKVANISKPAKIFSTESSHWHLNNVLKTLKSNIRKKEQVILHSKLKKLKKTLKNKNIKHILINLINTSK